MKDTLKLGKIISELRLKNDLSLRDLGEKSGVSYSFISSIEKNRYSPSRETIIAIANALKGADKNAMLLLAGFAPDDDAIGHPKKTDENTEQRENYDFRGGRAFYGGSERYSEEELAIADAAAKAAIEAYRKGKKKGQEDK